MKPPEKICHVQSLEIFQTGECITCGKGDTPQLHGTEAPALETFPDLA